MKTDNCSNRGNTAGETDAVNGHGAACYGGVGKDNEGIGARDTGGYARRIFIMIVALACFGLIAYQVSTGRSQGFDEAVSRKIYELRAVRLNEILVPITYMGNSMTIISVIAVLLLIPATRKNMGLPICISGSIVVAFYKVLKISFARPRPEEIYHIIRQGGFSFPSGHSMNGIFCYGMMIFLIRRHCKDRKTANILTAVLSLLIVSIGFSRIYVGVHYPSDVIGGFSMGVACLMAVTLGIDITACKSKPTAGRKSSI